MEQSFDIVRICALLEHLVGSRGDLRRIRVGDRNAHLALVPHESTVGSCVVVSIFGDVATVTAGVGARLKIAADGQGAEEELVSIVAGVLDGGAREYALVDDSGHLRLDLTATYATGSYSFPVTDEVLLRELPPWSATNA